MKTYITFIKIGDTGKTEIYEIKNGTQALGAIKWWARWRRYCFFPNAGSVWDAACLKEVQYFIDDLMDKRK